MAALVGNEKAVADKIMELCLGDFCSRPADDPQLPDLLDTKQWILERQANYNLLTRRRGAQIKPTVKVIAMSLLVGETVTENSVSTRIKAITSDLENNPLARLVLARGFETRGGAGKRGRLHVDVEIIFAIAKSIAPANGAQAQVPSSLNLSLSPEEYYARLEALAHSELQLQSTGMSHGCFPSFAGARAAQVTWGFGRD